MANTSSDIQEKRKAKLYFKVKERKIKNQILTVIC